MDVKSLGIGKADIIVGIPSFNEEKNIGFVTKQVALGLKKYFPDVSCAIINLDNNSQDDTKDVFLSTDTDGIPVFYASTEPGIRGKGNNLFNLFLIAKEVKPKVAITVDSDLKNITPEWVKRLCQPVLDGYDYVTPIYARHKYDGTITNNIVYPLVVGLLGKNIRQPIGGEFGFSSRLAEYWLEQEWDEQVRQFGIDIFMTIHAVIGGFKVCSAYLGAKIHKIKDPGESLGPMFKQVISSLFNIIKKHHEAFHNSGIEQIPVFGDNILQEPPMMCINTDTLLKAFNKGRIQCQALLKQTLSEKTYSELKSLNLETSKMPVDLWARILYDLLVAYEKNENHEELLEAIRPLYFGRVYSFAKESSGLNYEQAEEKIQEQAMRFYELRSYALEKLACDS